MVKGGPRDKKGHEKVSDVEGIGPLMIHEESLRVYHFVLHVVCARLLCHLKHHDESG